MTERCDICIYPVFEQAINESRISDTSVSTDFHKGEHHQTQGFSCLGFLQRSVQFNTIQAAEQAVPAPHHLHHRMNRSTDQGQPPVLQREGISFLSFPATHPSPFSPHHPPLPGPYPKHSMTVLHDTPDTSDTLPNHHTCWLLQCFCCMMPSKAQKMKQRSCAWVQQQTPELVFLLQLEVLSGEEGTANASTTGTGAPKQSFQSKAKCGAQEKQKEVFLC